MRPVGSALVGDIARLRPRPFECDLLEVGAAVSLTTVSMVAVRAPSTNMSWHLSKALIGFFSKVEVVTCSPPKLKADGTRCVPASVDTLSGWDPFVTPVSGDKRTVFVPSE
jgi:hypothetical protein